ncbi:hypothetical protein DNHGIG_11300 [Collibacillus ludicampi]|uniref:DUF4157 domain-containing protein n=1 Tax=Collibacillus ludicampi TaxID=2771369 RepID=A0AAV4LCX2_9BACL|nr:hypothetical protein [Collibacillus ludicampi]GIM45581.1 hypothetical protein DNHGIG_11300 [Collibacillus ludicampi]
MKKKKWSTTIVGLSLITVMAGTTGSAWAAGTNVPGGSHGKTFSLAVPLNSLLLPSSSVQIQVKTFDQQVKQDTLNHIRQMIQQNDMPGRIERELGIRLTQPVHLYVASDLNAYRDTLKRLQFPQDEIEAIAEKSNGVTAENDIVIVLSRNPGDGLLANVLQHELTHVALNQYGVSKEMPSWINEGIAWRLGLQAEASGRSQLLTDNETKELRYSVLDALAKNQWIPLISDPMDTITEKVSYNVEIQDYFAVDSLIRRYGEASFHKYLSYVKNGEKDPFLHAFGENEEAFEKRFIKDMNRFMKRTDKGVRIKFRVEANFSGYFALMGKGQSYWTRYRLPAGTYTAIIDPSGRITGLPQGERVPAPGTPDPDVVFIGIKPLHDRLSGKTIQNGGFAIESAYGDYFLLNAWTTYTDGSTDYPLTDHHLGITLLEIDTLS